MADNENADTVETTVTGKPETGDTTAETIQTDDKTGLEDKLAMWQAMSRENEKKMHANMKRATEAEGKLAEVQHQYADAQVQIARLKAQAAYPQLTDDVFAKLAPKDADAAAIEEWAKNAAAFIQPISNGAAPDAGPQKHDPVKLTEADRISADVARNATALHSIGSNKDDEKSGNEYGRKFASIKK